MHTYTHVPSVVLMVMLLLSLVIRKMVTMTRPK
jgi:hypothetical protein